MSSRTFMETLLCFIMSLLSLDSQRKPAVIFTTVYTTLLQILSLHSTIDQYKPTVFAPSCFFFTVLLKYSIFKQISLLLSICFFKIWSGWEKGGEREEVGENKLTESLWPEPKYWSFDEIQLSPLSLSSCHHVVLCLGLSLSLRSPPLPLTVVWFFSPSLWWFDLSPCSSALGLWLTLSVFY